MGDGDESRARSRDEPSAPDADERAADWGVPSTRILTVDGAPGARQKFFGIAQRMARATKEDRSAAIQAALTFAAETYQLERAYVRLLDDDGLVYTTAWEHHRRDLPPLSPRVVTARSVAWAHDSFLRGESIVLSSPDQLPPDDKGFRGALERVGVRATVSVPVLDGARLLGFVAYPAIEGRSWSRAEADLLALLGEMIAAVVARGRAEEELEDRVDFERLIAGITRRFVDIAPGAIDATLASTITEVCTSRKLQRAILARIDDAGALVVVHEWHVPEVPSSRELFSGPRDALSPVVQRALDGKTAGGLDDHPGDPDMADLLHRMKATGIVIAPLVVDGRVMGVLAMESVHERGEPMARVRRVKIFADVVGAVLSTHAARERRQKWDRLVAKILESTMDGVVVLDPRGRITEWTPQATVVLGHARDDMLGQELSLLVHEEDRASLAARLAAAVASAEEAQRFELRCPRAGGRARVIELSMTRFDGAEGHLVAAFLRDVTDQRKAFDEVARQKQTAERERDYLRQEQRAPRILGESSAIREAIEMCSAVADTASSVLLLGESGVGKELFAAAVHERSSRASRAFVKVNCASVPGTLFESEFFGHAKGSFTGAVKDRVGRFELADGGTLFLDEVGEIPFELQAKLLRVLQEGTIERVGEDRTRKLDVRIVAATNRDLAAEVEAGRFRGDLYFRLGVFPIAIPPLRVRGSDILILARHFLHLRTKEMGRTGLTLSKADEARLLGYEWPGNVRELDHVIERAVILSRTPPLRLDLALGLVGQVGERTVLAEAAVVAPGAVSKPAPRLSIPPAPVELLRETDLRRLERDNLVAALRRAGGRVSGPGGAAELLGMNPSTLRDRMKAFRIQRTDGS